jgi:hypothetical protein
MIRNARVFFLGRALREKLLLVAFIAIGVAWWLSSFGTRATVFWRDQRATTSRLFEQAVWIKNRTIIEENSQKTAARLDPARTLNLNQLVTKVAQLATEAGLKTFGNTGVPQTTSSGDFAVHSVEYQVTNADWDALRKFYEALQQQSPYIAVERFILSAAPNNWAQLRLVLKVTSVEIVR